MSEDEIPTETLPDTDGNEPVETEIADTADMDISMDIEEEPQSEDVPQPEKTAENVAHVDSDEAVEKSRIQKEAFMEMFRIAPKIKDILPDLRVFMSHPDVIEWDRREVEHLVEIRIQEEKAKKKAEKKKEKEVVVEKAPVVLADVIRSATGIDLAGILQKIPGSSQSPVVEGVVPVAGAPPNMLPIPPVVPAIPQSKSILPTPQIALSTSTITSVRRGKAGFTTPHPNEVPAELRHAKPDLIAPIPDELRAMQGRVEKEVPAIPNELLPPEQRVFDNLPIVFVRPPMRKTLFLAGARHGRRSDRIKPEEPKVGKKKKKKEELDENNRSKRPNLPPDDNRRKRGPSGMNALPQGLNKNSPLAVKRYHARQLSKDTGMTLEDAMAEIEEQCNEFGGEDTPEAREHDQKAMEIIKKYGDERWNQRYNYTPADHSKGIPGVDRPPAGLPPRKEREPIPGVDRPPGGDRREPIPGVDRPPGGDRREPIPGIDRPPGGGRGPIPGVDRPPGSGGGGDRDDFGGERRRNRVRGGVKERERRRRKEEFAGRGGGRGRGRGGGGGYDRWDDRGRGGPPPKHGRYEYDQRDRRPYDDYGPNRDSYRAADSYGGYGDDRGYDDYYGTQDGAYDNYPRQYPEEGGYDSYGGESSDAYYQGHQSQDSSYYQEDGGQYYNQYYGTGLEESAGGAPASEYHATFGTPSTATPATKQPPPPLN